MDEAEWLASSDSTRMLRLRRTNCCGCFWMDNGDGTVSLCADSRPCGQCDNGPITPYSPFSDRKLRLWASAACRQAHELTGGNQPSESIRLCDLSDQYADGLIPYSTLEAFKPSHPDCSWPLRYQDNVHITVLNIVNDKTFLLGQASLIRDIVGNPFRPVTLCGVTEGITKTEPTPTCQNCAAILAHEDGLVPRIARAIYDGRRWDEMPILADALEDAGCANEDILRHCRGQKERCPRCLGSGVFKQVHPWGDTFAAEIVSCDCRTGWVPLRDPGPHVRGCWVLDLMLSLE